MSRTWRDRARPVIEAALAEGRAQGLEGGDLLRHVRAAYPFGPRQHHPYRIWLDELRRQLGRHRRPGAARRDLPGQTFLFDP